jgi:hypothetical protein
MMRNSAFIAPKHLLGVSRWLTAVAILGLLCSSVTLPALAQVNVLTQHNDNTRTGLNASETILTPANVNASQFGIIATRPVDGLIAAEPLFVSNVNIPGQGVHNVVYVVTLHDSVYAFDGDSASGANANPLWQVSFLNPAAGITTQPAADLGCTSTTGFQEMGILGTPAIDAASQTMYVLAKTKENGAYHFRLHALDITSGMEKFGGSIDVNATVTGKLGALMLNGSSKSMLARPGLLLSQGIVYMAFGSNGCDGQNTRGWVVAYDATTLLQLGVFNDTLDTKAARGNIWQSGSGLASDDNGNIFFSTANGGFDANTGGNDYGSSIMKIGWGNNGGLVAKDYFTPYNVAYLNTTDLDVGSAGVLMLPDQPGPHPHLLVGSGKEGSVYVLDRDNLGQFNPVDNSQIVQFIPFDGNIVPPHSHTPPGSQVGRMFSTPAYWNGFVYLTGQNQGLTQFALDNGQMILLNRNDNALCCAHTPSISANGTTNGILWVPNGNGFVAFDASDASLPALYTNSKMGTLAHFNTPVIAGGRVFVGANLNLQVLGLLGNLQATSGSGQTAPSQGTLPLPFQVAATDPYTGAPVAGLTVTFSDGGKGGVFNPPTATAVTDASGLASISYTVPKLAGTYTITATYPTSRTATFPITVVGGIATHIVVVSGNKQTGPLQTTFPLPLVAQLSDASNNGVPGGTITFSVPLNGGTFSTNSVVTDSKGRAQTFYTSGTKSGAIAVTVTSGAFHQGMSETVQPGPATGMTIVSGNNQKAASASTLPAKLVAKVVDQFGNGIPGQSVTFSDGGVGGVFSASPITTDAAGKATVTYTLPPTPQVVHVTASVSGVGSVTFTETAQ